MTKGAVIKKIEMTNAGPKRHGSRITAEIHNKKLSCYLCGTPLIKGNATLDHKIPSYYVRLYNWQISNNCLPCCRSCNHEKVVQNRVILLDKLHHYLSRGFKKEERSILIGIELNLINLIGSAFVELK